MKYIIVLLLYICLIGMLLADNPDNGNNKKNKQLKYEKKKYDGLSPLRSSALASSSGSHIKSNSYTRKSELDLNEDAKSNKPVNNADKIMDKEASATAIKTHKQQQQQQRKIDRKVLHSKNDGDINNHNKNNKQRRKQTKLKGKVHKKRQTQQKQHGHRLKMKPHVTH